jgi:putative transposase
MSLDHKRALISSSHPILSIAKQCKLLDIHRSAFYYKSVGETELNLELMRLVDRIWTDNPHCGSRSIRDILNLDYGYQLSRKRIQRLMRLMNIQSIAPKPDLSKNKAPQYKYPYLLRGLNIGRKNQVWQVDITYIPMRRGFLYLSAVIDVYTHFVCGWTLTNTLHAESVHQMLQNAFKQHGPPEILNSDQGVQFTCQEYVDLLTNEGIKISMDGKGRATDNAFIERLWRTLKYEHVYVKPAENGKELYEGLKSYFDKYNYERRHSCIRKLRPADLYIAA